MLRRMPATTPALTVDEVVLRRNISTMAAQAAACGVDLWPHFKTHKCVDIARMQRDAGAVGFTCSTLLEAEVLASAGFDALLLVQPPAGRVERIRALAARVPSLRVTVDSLESASCLGDLDIDVLWEVDPGTGRTGTPPGAATAQLIHEMIEACPSLRFRGLLTFAGHAYAASGVDGVREVALQEADAMRATIEFLEVDCPLASVGSTPTMSFLSEQGIATEARPGNYVYRDATQVALGTCSVDDCALSVVGTVTARPTPTRAILDSGSKAIAAERMTPLTPYFGLVRDHPDIRVMKLYEEHAILEADTPIPFTIGDQVQVIPNHSCTAANLHTHLTLSPSGTTLPITARGWTHPPAATP
jgi:D-serine deaminase-like pyridoxal phosphate-dependent protein